MTTTITQEQLSYLKELALDIAKHGGLEGKDMAIAVKEAHARRQQFALEMMELKTIRAKMARKALQAQIWAEINIQSAKDTVIKHCEYLK